MNHFWHDCKQGLFWVYGGPLDMDTVDFICNVIVPGKVEKDVMLEQHLIMIGNGDI